MYSHLLFSKGKESQKFDTFPETDKRGSHKDDNITKKNIQN